MAPDTVPGDDWLMSGTAEASEVAERYDAWADSYDTDLDSWSYQAPATAAGTLLDLDPRPGSVLDVGCGTGLVGKALRSLGYDGRLVGLDISSVSLRLALESGAYDEVREADLTRPLPVDDDTADAVVCVGVMTYLADTEAVWREFARAARRHVLVTQREDLWESRHCQDVVDRIAADGTWTPLGVTGPSPYLPDATGSLGGLGCYYVLADVR
jgi:SAM-dependent methyltransferase